MVGNLSEAVVVVVENGTADVVLDCPYELDEDDKPSLVVQWFLEDSTTPIFQWIPGGQQTLPQVGYFAVVVYVNNRSSRDRLIGPLPA